MNHPSPTLSQNTTEKIINLFFTLVEKGDITKELLKLNPKTATQETDKPVKVLKDNKCFSVG